MAEDYSENSIFRPRKPLTGTHGFWAAAMVWFQAAVKEEYGLSELF